MNYIEAILFGLLQGISEFLPISSSGHLALLKELLDLSEIPLVYDVLLHMATLAAVCIVFRKKLAALIASCFRFVIRKNSEADKDNLNYALAIIIGTFFTAIIGIIIRKFFPELSVKLISAFFLLTAAFLIAGHFLGRWQERRQERRPACKNPAIKQRPVLVRDGLVTGIAQGLGVFPGISRSGITISAALATGVSRETAGELSFLLSIPAILGAFILELKDADTLMGQMDLLPLALGLLTAFVSGLFALKFLMALIRRGSLALFAIWLIPLGCIGLFLL